MARWRSKATAGKLISRSLHLRLSFFNSLSALSLALLFITFTFLAGSFETLWGWSVISFERLIDLVIVVGA